MSNLLIGTQRYFNKRLDYLAIIYHLYISKNYIRLHFYFSDM